MNKIINAIKISIVNNFNSIAFPIIGTGTGSFSEVKALEIMNTALENINNNLDVIIVKFTK